MTRLVINYMVINHKVINRVVINRVIDRVRSSLPNIPRSFCPLDHFAMKPDNLNRAQFFNDRL